MTEVQSPGDEKAAILKHEGSLTPDQSRKLNSFAVNGIRKRNSLLPEEMRKDVTLEGNVKFINAVDLPAEVMCCRFDNTGKLLAIGLANGTIKIYSLESRKIVYNLQATGQDNYLPITCLRWKPDRKEQKYGNILLALYASGFVRHWHVTTGKCLREHFDKAQMMACAYNNTGSHFVVGRSDGKIDIYDEETGKVERMLEPSVNSSMMDGHVMRIFSVAFNPVDDNMFISAGWDDTVQWWDARASGKYSIKKLSGPHVCGEGLDINPNNQNIVTASWRKDHNLQIFDFSSGKLISEIPSAADDRSMLYCVQWLNRETLICGGTQGNMMKYVDITSKQTVGRVHNLPGAVTSIDNCNHSSHQVVAVCAGKSVYFIREDTK